MCWELATGDWLRRDIDKPVCGAQQSPVLSLLFALLLQGSPPQSAPSPQPAPAAATVSPVYVPERVYDTRRNAFTDFEAMLADLARADVVTVGEQHDDPNPHRLEAAILYVLLRGKVAVTVSLEMFERDVQRILDAYLAGSLAKGDFLKQSRPWPRYATDYRPLVEMARENRWAVVAANVPRRIASGVARAGQAALDGLPPDERRLAAAELQCPRDAYFDRFAATMSGHPVPG